jgi:hypothetical protein
LTVTATDVEAPEGVGSSAGQLGGTSRVPGCGFCVVTTSGPKFGLGWSSGSVVVCTATPGSAGIGLPTKSGAISGM